MSGRAINPCVNTARSAVYTWTRGNTNAARTIRTRDTSGMIHTFEKKMERRKRKKNLRRKKEGKREKESLSGLVLVKRCEGGSLSVNLLPPPRVTNRLIILYRLAFVTDVCYNGAMQIRLTFSCLMRCLLNSEEKGITRVAINGTRGGSGCISRPPNSYRHESVPFRSREYSLENNVRYQIVNIID